MMALFVKWIPPKLANAMADKCVTRTVEKTIAVPDWTIVRYPYAWGRVGLPLVVLLLVGFDKDIVKSRLSLSEREYKVIEIYALSLQGKKKMYPSQSTFLFSLLGTPCCTSSECVNCSLGYLSASYIICLLHFLCITMSQKMWLDEKFIWNRVTVQ